LLGNLSVFVLNNLRLGVADCTGQNSGITPLFMSLEELILSKSMARTSYTGAVCYWRNKS